MRGFDAAAWGDALGVGPKEVPWALSARLRQIEDLHSEAAQLRNSFREAPDEEMIMSFEAACRAIGAAGDRLTACLADSRRIEA